MLLEGKVALVSGAGAGLGRAICRRFAAEGARLVVGDLDGQAVSDTLGEVSSSGVQAVGQPTDITDGEQCRALVELGSDRMGGIDILVNDAYHGGDFRRFEDADLADWKATAEVNVWGSLTLTKAALPCLKAANEGRVVMICTHGVDLIQPSFGAYTGSKAALAHLTKMLAAELGSYGIRVNAVFPGPIWGPNLQGYLDQQASARGVAPRDVYEEFAGLNALKYLVPPDEIAGAVTFFASELARPITGQALYVNSGGVLPLTVGADNLDGRGGSTVATAGGGDGVPGARAKWCDGQPAVPGRHDVRQPGQPGSRGLHPDHPRSPRCRGQLHRHRRRIQLRRVGGDRGQGGAGVPRGRRRGHQAAPPHERRGAQPAGLDPQLDSPGVRGILAKARHRLHRSFPASSS